MSLDAQTVVGVTEQQATSLEKQEPMLQFFHYAHLPDSLQLVSAKFWALAHELVMTLPRNAERTTAIRRLLEAKDCAVRARLYREP